MYKLSAIFDTPQFSLLFVATVQLIHIFFFRLK